MAKSKSSNLARQIIKINQSIASLTKKADSVKDQSAKEEAGYHAALTEKYAVSLGKALKSQSTISKLSTHRAPAKKGKRK